jgi:2-oxoglutarate dehydrogenase E2 component (dihydrolipoamide succinyltransferase)
MIMATPIKIPSVGESIAEGTIARWLKKDGERVAADEPIFELETEKASSEVPAPAAGVLHIKEREGAKVAIGAVVGEIDSSGDGAAAKSLAPQHRVEPTAEKSAPPPAKPGSDGRAAPPKPEPAPVAPAMLEKPASPPPALTAIAERERLPSADDVSAKRQAAGARESRQRMSAIRQRIAERLLASQQATASLTTFNEADMSAIIDVRQRFKDQFKEQHGVGLGFMSFFVKACIAALKSYPIVNSRIDGEDIVTCNYWNIGVAVSTEKGLMVPVLRDADQMSFAGIEKALADLAGKARDGKINVADLQGGTFTITNGGVFGSMLSTPILNPPQSAILGMHAVQKRPVAVGEQIVIRPMMYLALTYDHRLIDGREAVLFLVRVKECIENPLRLLIEA